MARKYKRLRYEDRKTLDKLLRAGDSVADAAGALGVHRDTIYKEFARSGTDHHTYSADAGQRAI